MSTDEIDAKKREKLIASIEASLKSLGLTLDEAKEATVIAQYLVEHDVMVYHDVPDNNGKESL